MPGLTVHFEVLNQLNSPALYADTLANRPAAQLVGRIFFRTDSPFGIYRDTGTSWDLIASPDTTGISGSGLAGQVPYFTGASTIGGTNNLFWDSTNNRLGIGTATPGVALDIHGAGGLIHLNGTGTNNSFQLFQNAGVNKWRIGNNYSTGTNYFSIYDNTNASEIIKIESGTTALNGTLTNTAKISNNYTEVSIGTSTIVGGFRQDSSYTYTAGITRTGQTDVGTSISSTFTLGGAFTKSDTGQWNNANFPFNIVLNGTVTQNQPGPYIIAPSSGRFGLVPSGTGTISHFANIVSAPDFGGTSVTVTNRYGILINNFAGFTNNPIYTNRWALYQDGSSDNNYFAGKVNIGSTTIGTDALYVVGNFKLDGTSIFNGNITLSNTYNFVFSSSQGSKIGTAITQKIGFWNATPIAQPTTATASATFVANAGTAINTLSTFDGYKIDQVVKALRNAGLLA